MTLRRRTDLIIAVAALAFSFGAAPGPGHAFQAASETGAPIPCAVLEKFAGPVQILDASRTHLIDATGRAAIPCGGWVSLDKGWAELKHRDGFRIHVGSQSFVQFPENSVDGKRSGDSVILFKGQVYGRASGGEGELRIATANSRARVSRGAVIMIFNHEAEESQLIALENSSSFENRFENARKVKVRPGEASNLNLRMLRVVPSTPRAISLASLRPKFLALHVNEAEQNRMARLAKFRADRKFASVITPEPTERKVASQGGDGDSHRLNTEEQISLNELDAANPEGREDAQLHQHWVDRMVAGQKEGESMLFPDQMTGGGSKGRSGRAALTDPARKLRDQAKQDEEKERKKLVDELSRIRPE